jgi:hypothetical protein
MNALMKRKIYLPLTTRFYVSYKFFLMNKLKKQTIKYCPYWIQKNF